MPKANQKAAKKEEGTAMTQQEQQLLALLNRVQGDLSKLQSDIEVYKQYIYGQQQQKDVDKKE